MTDKEKARAYDEAPNWMRAMYPTLSVADKEDAEHFFPQLAESEDEKIRKELLKEIEFISPRDGETDSEGLILPSYRARIDKYRTYLEKQKEQKLESCDCSRDEESYINGIHHVLMNPEAYGLIKQKPAEQLGGTFTSYDMAKTFTEGQNYVIAHPEKFGLCKPAEWSEEDEVMLKEIVSFFKDGSVKLQHDLDLYAAFLEKRLKSLCPKPYWKPSEKEITAFENMLKGEFPDGIFPGVTLSELLTKLKKLYYNEQIPYWKPSKEQMDHLAYAYTQLKLQKCYAPHVYESLGSLYDDLKKHFSI